jgi:hypothetical protein
MSKTGFWKVPLVGCCLLALCATGAQASSVTVNGLTFTSLDDSILKILGGSGTGSLADPIVLQEEVYGLDVTMSIAGLSASWGNPANTGHTAGFALVKEVVNKTGETWNFYDHELQEELGTPSSDGDGLSFAQGPLNDPRPWTSDKFGSYYEIILPRDYVNFYDGSVAPDETVTFYYVITDNTPIDPFYLRQRPNYDVSGIIPEPMTMLSALLGLGALGGYIRKRRAA